MAYSDYQKALKIGERTYKRTSFLPVLEERIAKEPPMFQVRLGLIEIPVELIKGTYSSGRTNAFASDFMPLLAPDTEFAAKWSDLYDALCEQGQRDPVVAIEYLNDYYIVEGNKRVSVQKYMGSVTIEAYVTRLIPQRDDSDIVNRIYYEFLDFYAKTKINYILMSHEGSYERLYRYIHSGDDCKLTEDESIEIKYIYSCFKKAYLEKGGDKLNKIKIGEQLLNYIDIFGYENVREQNSADIRENINKVWSELVMKSVDEPVQMVEEKGEQKINLAHSIVNMISGNSQPLKVAFVHFKDPEESGWTNSHEVAREFVQKKFGDKIETAKFVTHDSSDIDFLENIINDGYKLIFTTTPVLSSISLRCAIEHPDVVICNCSLNIAYKHLRTYYLRIYEAKYIIGAIAGAMTEADRIGYIADYPIFGMPASLNAFAMGVSLTNPRATVYLAWSTLKDGDPLEYLASKNVDIVSCQDLAPREKSNSIDHGLYNFFDIDDKMSVQNNEQRFLARPVWNWSVVYESIISSVLNGAWKSEENIHGQQGLNYYWGMSTNAISVKLSPSIPSGVGQLHYIISEMVKHGQMQPFSRELCTQKGKIVNTTGNKMANSDIIKIDWFNENIDGNIPDISQFKEDSHELISQLGIKLGYTL